MPQELTPTQNELLQRIAADLANKPERERDLRGYCDLLDEQDRLPELVAQLEEESKRVLAAATCPECGGIK